MLSEWYFCCCIKSNPEQANAFLSILETLENPESDSELLFLAYDELTRTEIWMQIFALPYVLESLHREDLPENIRNIVEPYFTNLIELIPEKSKSNRLFNVLIDDILSHAEADKLISTLQACCSQKDHDLSTERNSTTTPYLDLRTFFPETLLLAIIFVQLLHSDGTFAPKLSIVLGQEESLSSLVSLIQAALKYKFGRLAFRLACRIAQAVMPEYSQKDILSFIWAFPSSSVEFEPDLLQTSVEVLFLDKSLSIDTEKIIQEIVEESLLFRQLRRLFKENPERGKNFSSPFRRIGAKVKVSESLSPIYWQLSLWEVALKINRITTAEMLCDYWAMPTSDLSEKIYMSHPFSEQEEFAWKNQLFSLLKLQGAIDGKRRYFYLRSGQKLDIPKKALWLFTSPWLFLSYKHGKHSQVEGSKGVSYPMARNIPVLLRLIVSASISVKLLQSLPKKKTPVGLALASLIAHASHVLSSVYRTWLFDYNKADGGSKCLSLPVPITGLALFGQRQIGLAGKGHLASISPDIFLEILQKSQEVGTQTRSEDETMFLTQILPEVLMSWIADAYPGAISLKGAGRWLNYIPDVYYYYKRGSHPLVRQISDALLVRFLCPDYNKLKEFDWRTASDEWGQMKWRVRHRQLLLTQDLPPSEWDRPDWPESDLSAEGDSETSRRLARALERLTSLKRGDDTEKDKYKEWNDEWKEALYQVSELKEIDRFIRLRLLEILDDPILKDSKDSLEGQELIVHILLEYGGLYELKKMFDRVYVLDNQEKREKANVFRRDLRMVLLKAMYKTKEIELLKSERRYNAYDPYYSRRSYDKLELIETTLTRIANVLRQENAESEASSLGFDLGELRELHQGFLNKNIKETARIVKADVELRGKDRQIYPGEIEIENWMIQGAACDPNMLTTTIFIDDLETTGVINLFQKSEKEVGKFVNNGRTDASANVLGVVVSRDKGNNDRGDKYTFNCGFKKYVTKNFIDKQPFQPGDYVILSMQWDPYRKRWDVLDKICQLNNKLIPGDIDKIEIFEHWHEREEMYQLRLKHSRDDITDKVDLDIWDTDISRRFRHFSRDREESSFVLAELYKSDKDEQWIPIDLDLTTLLLNVFDDTNVAVLTFINAEFSQFGERAWRFSARPGENYLIPKSQFSPDSAHELEDKIQELFQKFDDPKGLLVTVRPCDSKDGSVRLVLVDDEVNSGKLEERYPNLETPFDSRNIKWRNFLYRSESEIAKKKEHNWYVEVDRTLISLGFPGYVTVEWDKHRPPSDTTEAEFIVTNWDERTNEVKGDNIQSNRIDPKNGDWKGFLDRWLSPKKGNRVKLTKILGNIRTEGGDGCINCLTDEGFVVRVEAESLTMKPVELQGRLEIPENSRMAEISRTSGDRSGTPVEIDLETIPSELLNGNSCTGLLTQVPKRSTTGSLCMVCWQSNNEVPQKPLPLKIENLEDLQHQGIHPGCKIIGKRRGAEWEFKIYSLRIFVRALWSLTEWQPDHTTLSYLGTVTYQRKERHVAELEPGKLILLPPQTENIRHLAEGDGIHFGGGVDPNSRMMNTARWIHWKEYSGEYCRTVLKTGNRILIGNCRADSPDKDMVIKNVQMSLYKSKKGGHLYSLRRRFRLQYVKETKFRKRAKSTERSIDFWKQRLKKHLEASHDSYDYTKNATFEKKRVKFDISNPNNPDALMVPTDCEAEWTQYVPLAKDEGAFVAEGEYTNDAVVRLFEDDQKKIWASFRRVPAYTPKQFMDAVGADFNKPIHLPYYLASKLYYVGPETADPITGEAYGARHHRFEWGYGQTLLVSENRLLFNNASFDTAKLILFHADAIIKITFFPVHDTKKTTPLSDSKSEKISECIIAIDDVNLRFSESRTLYQQRRDHKIIHPLYLVKQEEIQIEYIEGFDDDIKERSVRAFQRAKAKLNQKSQERLSERFQAKKQIGIERKQHFVVLGRLDEKHFEETLGQEGVVFDHVRLSFEESDRGTPLREDGELVFLKAGEIIPIPNDMALQVSAIDNLDKRDIGSDFQDMILLRRSFSVREELLKQIYQVEGPGSCLNKTLILIQITRRNDGKPSLSLLRGVPSRRVYALFGEIEHSEDLSFATIIWSDKRGIKIEWKPGIFIRIPRYKIKEYSKNLTKGAIVRIENTAHKKFRITRAAFGDRRYVTTIPRPAVALPKNDLLKKKIWHYDVGKDNPWLDHTWQDNIKFSTGFTIGGLPNLSVAPGSYRKTDPGWSSPKAQDFVKLMETKHPKIVCLGKDTHHQPRIGLQSGNWEVGKLDIIAQDFEVRYTPLSEKTDDSSYRGLHWPFLSFGDEPVTEIIKRIRQERWRYHDDRTGTWNVTNQSIEPQKLGDHNGETGPLFFQLKSENLRLRYTEDRFLQFGFPVDELIHSLEAKEAKERADKKGTYPIVGTSHEGGLWIEISPGRIVELPAQLLVWRVKEEGKEKSLSNLNWQAFAPGDQITLRLATSNLLTIDRLVLRSWNPGPRKAFGPKRCFLPVQEYNEDNGSIKLGAGEFTLTFPFSRPDPSLQTVILYPDNRLQDAGKMLPEEGDVVFLGLDESEEPIVLGFPGFSHLPESKKPEIWKDDPFRSDFITEYQGEYSFGKRRIQELIHAVGGALPVTVEFVFQEKVLYFSRRFQYADSSIPRGTVSLGRVIGLYDERTALLRCGSGIIKVPMKKIISGLPVNFFGVAAETLKKSEVNIWLRGEEGEIRCGINNEKNQEILVEVLEVCVRNLEDTQKLENNHSPEAGLICQAIDSMILYWLPITRISWTELSAEQLDDIFIKSPERKILKVKRIDKPGWTDSVSVIDALEVRKEFNSLKIGKKFTVNVIKKIEDERGESTRYLVEPSNLKVILECATYNDIELKTREAPVEVVQKVCGEQCLVTVVPVGKKRYHLDLPSWVVTTIPKSKPQIRKEFRSYLDWRGGKIDFSEQEVMHEVETGVRELDDQKINQFLCYAYNTLDEHISYERLRIQVNIAKEWIERNKTRPEVDVAYAIMAILLLQKNGSRDLNDLAKLLQLETKTISMWDHDWKDIAREMTQNLGRRALRSLHVEVLIRQWLYHQTYQSRKVGLWKRLQLMKENPNLKQCNPLKLEDIRAIRQFCYAVELRNINKVRELVSIADGLSAAIGELSRISELSSKAEVTKTLIDIYRTLPETRSRYSVPLHDSHVRELTRLLELITIRSLDITLLDPLPQIVPKS